MNQLNKMEINISQLIMLGVRTSKQTTSISYITVVTTRQSVKL